ncbi:hypothetical protein QBC47DRAFT_398481 [Echria macrotheca]|uniref:Uncharacterized protein n=1 Tax=Echria macrotheca TaxID=438768 RepID=A0AAJ0FDT8_9PEZI|nr:hypothetical protein QBC47DRAFT_398481 [Echria macrotheca]
MTWQQERRATEQQERREAAKSRRALVREELKKQYGPVSTSVNRNDYESSVTGVVDLSDYDFSADDAATIYSASQYVDERPVDMYKSQFADRLCEQARSLGLDAEAKEHIIDLLPNLLENFALRLGQHTSSRAESEAMYLIHKYRGDITRRFREDLLETTVDKDSSFWHPEPIAKDDLDHNVKSWLHEVTDTPGRASRGESAHHDVYGPVTSLDQSWEDTLHDVDPLTLPDEPRDLEIAFQSPAFKWLLASLGKASNLRPAASDDAITRVRDKVMDAFPRTHYVSSRCPSTVYTMKFKCLWGIHDFLDCEYPELGSGRARLGEVITITGYPADAQALSCSGYLEQTWPFTGLVVLELLQAAVDKDGQTATRKLPDRTRARAKVLKDSKSLSVKVQGTVDAIAEIGEQIAWITTALSPGATSGGPEAPSYRYPTITEISGYDDNKVASIEWSTVHQQDLDDVSPNGTCWESMFRNPVVVMGYPIRRRPNDGTGLEIPLNMMAGLVQSDRLNHFLGNSYIKGFSSMLVAVEHVGGTYIWHHHSNPYGDRVSYLDAGATAVGCASPHELATSRHIVGWCTKADSRAGSPLLNYDIRGSGLPHAGRDVGLEKFTLTGGLFVTGGLTATPGQKDTPIHISKNGYIDKLRWISQKYVVFWDVEDKRGWMVNGSDALLHLLRGSLEHSRTDKFSSQFLFDFSKLREGPAIKVLVDQENRRLPVYQANEKTYTEKTTLSSGKTDTVTKTITPMTTFGDKVEELYEYLEKMIDHKCQIENPTVFRAKIRFRRHLEGWDFKDFATGRDPSHLRVATLPSNAFSWVELTRVARAITIFGKQFGELVVPSIGSSKTACPNWRSVPTGKHYLCVCLADIRNIIEDAGGDIACTPVLVSPKLAWLNPSKTCPFAECMCERPHRANMSSLGSHLDPVQQLIPNRLVQRVMPKGPLDLQSFDDGAVIFGQGVGFRWKWPDDGEGGDETEDRHSSITPSPSRPSVVQVQDSYETPLADTNTNISTSGTANSDHSSLISRTGGASALSNSAVIPGTPASSQSESTPGQIPPQYPQHARPGSHLGAGEERPLSQPDEGEVVDDPRKKSRIRYLAFRRS